MSQAPKDEIWITEDGTQILVGDLTEAHAKNILRMILRHRREEREAMQEVFKAVAPQLNEMIDMIAQDTGLPAEQIREDFRLQGFEVPTDEAKDAAGITTTNDIDRMFDRITPPTDPKKLN
jgi:hypothetical protein